MKTKITFLIILAISLMSSSLIAKEPTPISEDPQSVKPLNVGDQVPNVTLTNAEGIKVNLLELVKKQPSILIFYRGGWCVYCNKHLGQLKTIETPLQKLGFQIIAMSPDSVKKVRESLKEHNVQYMLLSDSDAEAIKGFGLAFRLDNSTFNKYKNKYQIDIEADSGKKHRLLPVPAAYVVDKNGILKYRYFNPDYKVRVDPQEILKAAEATVQK